MYIHVYSHLYSAKLPRLLNHIKDAEKVIVGENKIITEKFLRVIENNYI